MTKRYNRPLTLAELAAIPDEEIDYRDIPKATAKFWASAERIEPETRNLVSIRVPREVVEYFQRDGAKGYTARMARVLSAYVKMQTGQP